MNSKKALGIAIVLFAVMFCFAGCNESTDKTRGEDEKPLVIATLFPQYDFVKQIAGDKVEVILLLPPGVEPHSYEPTPRDIVDIQKADMFVYTGEIMEPWAERIIDAAKGQPLLIVDTSIGIELIDEDEDHHHHHEHDDHLAGLIKDIDHYIHEWEDGDLSAEEALEAIDDLVHHFFADHEHDCDHDDEALIKEIDHYIHEWEDGDLSAEEAMEAIEDLVHHFFADHENDHGHGHGHDHGGKDPHFWLDPLLAKVMVDHVIAGLVEIDPENEGFYRESGEDYKLKLQELHEKLKSSLAGLENRTILYAGHFAFGYFAHRYDFNHISPYEGFAPDAEPTPGNIAELIKRVSESNARVIYYEELIDPKVARVVAEQTGAEMVLLHGAHNVTAEERERGVTYISIMEGNLVKLLEGLQ